MDAYPAYEYLSRGKGVKYYYYFFAKFCFFTAAGEEDDGGVRRGRQRRRARLTPRVVIKVEVRKKGARGKFKTGRYVKK